MKFYIYHKPLLSVRKKKFLGDLVYLTKEKTDGFSPDGTQGWSVVQCKSKDFRFDRAQKMFDRDGIPSDGIYPLSHGRTVKDFISIMKTWRE